MSDAYLFTLTVAITLFIVCICHLPRRRYVLGLLGSILLTIFVVVGMGQQGLGTLATANGILSAGFLVVLPRGLKKLSAAYVALIVFALVVDAFTRF